MSVTNNVDRRMMLRGAAVVAAGAAAGATLVACGADDTESAGAATTTAGGIGGAAPADAESGSAVLGPATDVVVGGGMIYKDQDVVVTQPTSGSFKAFSSVCTHQGCAVTSIQDGAIICPCHNSKFSISDGSVMTGPATEPLPEKTVTVADGSITLG